MTQLTLNGFERTRLDQRLADLESAAKVIFGNEIDLASDSMDGQHLALFAERLASLDELAELVWQSFDPDSATGLSLSRLVKINGINRSLGAYSVVDLQLTGTPNTLIPKGSIISNINNSVSVYTTDDVRLDVTGTGLVRATTLEMGVITASANSLTQIRSPVFGWDAVNNPVAMTVGKVQETDSKLRQRRSASVSVGNRNMVESLQAALQDLPNVIEARVLENDTDLINSLGLPAHSIHCVISGGDDQQIADTIWRRKTGGTTLAGLQAVKVTDINGYPHDVRFTRPTDVAVKVRISVSPRPTWSFTKPTQIKNVLAQYVAETQSVGDELANSELYTPLNNLGGFVTNSIELARVDQPLVEQNISVAFYERTSLSISDIEVVIE